MPPPARSIRRFRVDWRAEGAKARTMLESYGVTIDPRTVVNELPPVGQALVAIARAAEELREYRERTGATTSVLVLDEPTVFLPEEELQFLFDLIREVVAQGSSVIFISHDLAAVRTIADRVTVLRDGKLAALGIDGRRHRRADRRVHRRPGEVPRTARARRPVPPRPGGRPLGRAAARRVRARRRPRARPRLRRGPGEIVGLAGLLGSGAEEVPYLLFGAQRAAAGTDARIKGREVDLTKHQPASAVGMGLSFIPADRNRDGIAREIEIDRNMMALVLRRFTSRWAAAQPSPPVDSRWNGPTTSTSGRGAPTCTPAR